MSSCCQYSFTLKRVFDMPCDVMCVKSKMYILCHLVHFQRYLTTQLYWSCKCGILSVTHVNIKRRMNTNPSLHLLYRTSYISQWCLFILRQMNSANIRGPLRCFSIAPNSLSKHWVPVHSPRRLHVCLTCHQLSSCLVIKKNIAQDYCTITSGKTLFESFETKADATDCKLYIACRNIKD